MRAKEKAEAPTVKTKEETEKEEARTAKVKEHEAKTGQKDDAARPKAKDPHAAKEAAPTSLRKRKFRPLPEAKAVDLFADVVGDSFVLVVAGALIIYEYYRSSQKPDANLERVKELNQQLDELRKKDDERAEDEKRTESRLLAMEAALRNYKDPKTKQPLLPAPTPAA